jgi:hypothetical protein
MQSLFFLDRTNEISTDVVARKLFEEEEPTPKPDEKSSDISFDSSSGLPTSGTLVRLLQWMATANTDVRVLDAFLLGYKAAGLTPYDLVIHIHKMYPN